ncbi:MAG: AGE family epimerase/isomerase [Sphaerochaeta sp.]|nr:AGE family epimerase/isomerase [Sphaerochaeta sp.]
MENNDLLLKLEKKYSGELFDNVIPFWLRYSLDKECGGYCSCIDYDGTVFDTDKYAWMQGREIFVFSKLCILYGIKDEWRNAAKHGVDFMLAHGKAMNGDYYFALDRSGRPLIQPYNIFSDCFLCIGFADYSLIAETEEERTRAKDEALRLYQRIQIRKSNPKGVWSKQVPGGRSLQVMSMPMIEAMLAIELQGFLGDDVVQQKEDEVLRLFLDRHVDRNRKCVFERVNPDGSLMLDVMEGRLLNPGHALEILWFLMTIAEGRHDQATIDDLSEIMLWCIDRGWDEKYGGIFYYRDYENRPLDKFESDMKLWWVHVEAINAFLLAWKLTGKPIFRDWFLKIDEWTWSHFPDHEHGEWYGYLSRQGEVASTLKGGKWKGFFHLPRMLYTCSGWLKEMQA